MPGSRQPYIVIPATSTLPTSDVLTDEEALTFRSELTTLKSRLEAPLPQGEEVRSAITALAYAVKCASTAQFQRATAATEISEEDARLALRSTLTEEDDPEREEEFFVYDRYFGVIRSTEYGIRNLDDQLSVLIIRLLEDLGTAVLGVDEIAALVHAAEQMLHYCHTSGTGDISSPHEAESGDQLDGPMYRWMIGHQFFAVSSQFSRHFLIAAADGATNGEDPGEIGILIRTAEVFLRGTTAAMWYAANMSRQVYVDTIRPSMDAVWDGGFSGTQNLDYERMKRAREATLSRLTDRYGDSLRDWPTDVSSALATYCETEVEDLEHHTLIAASKVSREASLMQDAAHRWMQAEGTGSSAVPVAVDMLRSMAHERRDSLRKFLSATSRGSE
ncbi:MAG: hypothetical protein HOY79_08645 [Streptomyces sp.]|nr:hypothetical protein [Streptomyces sp.]